MNLDSSEGSHLMTPLEQEAAKKAVRPPVPKPFLVALIGGLLLLALVAWPVRIPLFFAIVLAVTTRPTFHRLIGLFGGRRRLAGATMTLLLLACLVVPTVSIAGAVLREVTDGVTWMRDSLGFHEGDPISVPDGVDRAVGKLADTLHVGKDDMRSYANRVVRAVQGTASTVITVSLGLFGNTLLLLIAFYFCTVDGPTIGNFLGRVSPLRPEQTHELLGEFRNVTRGAVWSTVCNCVGQGLIMFAGFFVAGVPHALFFGILAVFAALIPLVGSMLVWAPAVAILVASGKPVHATVLAIWCLVMVAVVDNTVKPLVLRGKIEIHAGLLLLGFVGGVAVFGLSGLVAGPLVVAFVLTLLRIYQRDYLNQAVRLN